jgi:DNA-binding MarR family transcriptional regulator
VTDLFGDGPPAGSLQFAQQEAAGEAYARRTDPIQSHAAAHRVDASRLERVAYNTLLLCGPLTSKQIAARSGEDKWSISPRLKPLERKGLVRRHAKDGRETVWAACPNP